MSGTGSMKRRTKNTTETKGSLWGTESTWHMAMLYELPWSGESEWEQCAWRTHAWMERSSQTCMQGCCSQHVACQARGWRVWKFWQFLSSSGGLPSQMLPLEKRTRGEQTRGESRATDTTYSMTQVSAHSGPHPHWAAQKDSWTQVSWKRKHGMKTFLHAPENTPVTAFHAFICLSDGTVTCCSLLHFSVAEHFDAK